MSGTSIEFSTVLDLCRDQQRRLVLAVLADQQRPLTLNDLTKTVIKHDQQASVTEVSGEILRQTRIRLHHVHIPKLEEENLIEYDRTRKLVAPTEDMDRVQPHLSAILDSDPTLEPPTEL